MPGIVRVALDLPIQSPFDFLPPEDWSEKEGGLDGLIGCVVLVPFGQKRLIGVVTETAPTSALALDKLRAVLAVRDDLLRFTQADMDLFRFAETYYHCPLGQVLANALPPIVRSSREVAKVVPTWKLSAAGQQVLPQLAFRAPNQHALLDALAQRGPLVQNELTSGQTRGAAILRVLFTKGWVEECEAVVPTVPVSDPVERARFVDAVELNADQAAALAAIASAVRGPTYATFLLEGITGSGKTEVYLHAVAETLRGGRQALMLVPEINLSPAFMRHITSRFPLANVVQLHSGLTGTARRDAFVQAQNGRADIIVGTRSAIFVPLPRLGLVVVDEEHDASFKQQEGLRYSARDIAIYRGRTHGCPVVLGSATPSLESVLNAERKRFQLLRLGARAAAGARLPTVQFVDLDQERAVDGLTNTLVEAIAATVARGEQALVFINRRGFAPALVCAQCGWTPECNRCSARLVFHRGESRLRCHHCGQQTRVVTACVTCGSVDLVPSGQGTERIESALRLRLQAWHPNIRIARVDRDSTRVRGSAESLFAATARREIDVLVGTQMLSKGHDFPQLTLVGVVNADGAVFSADFRAAERLVAQLMQVGGRAGRGSKAGRVLIQTRFPQHPLYQAVAQHNYRHFAETALQERRHAHMPPYSFLALLRAEARELASLEAFLLTVAATARTLTQEGGLQVWDPVPPVLARKAGFERRQLLIQSFSRSSLQRFLEAWLPQVRAVPTRGVKWVIDVDPSEV